MKIDMEEKYAELISMHTGDSNSLKLNMLNIPERYIFIGIEPETNHLYLLLELRDEETRDVKIDVLPKLRGLRISKNYVKQLGPIEDGYTLMFSQEKEQDKEIFISFVQNLVDNVLFTELSFSQAMYSVLERWQYFFGKRNDKKLSSQQQQGLFGELYFIIMWMDKFRDSPPILIHNWWGPNGYRFDFLQKNIGIEVKTTVATSNMISISNESQLRMTKGLKSLFLMVFNLSILDSDDGETLDGLVNKLKLKLDQYPETLTLFENKLLDAKYESGVYTHPYYFINSGEGYAIDDDFPKITKLEKGITSVKYTIDLNFCTAHKCDSEDVFDLLGEVL
ncbi:PD-(D/E)XK motif protein [Listeria grandensis]|uniref:PD-(D/E)XK motif protein n=1 Tax=Listeria grandensis TaxID=1494963 RepID=A0A7X1CPL6_9LIST|nr:PD-(D/E)XK motif protein [Listeria grandensis]MBC1936082.1 PD-(D/E)XK motif protein [Listeria grandensis]MBC6316103.1 PD-(D/E)XK motif protein [Listeria grandensis]